ncbi:MAG TPA: sigma-70 family RNA polymerase sigma factor [Actinomycetota bacterium]|jgi:RNA polymerase sigma factor (sigma-70 family)|nr:sigma-70 family RNA polymerase sigma factor [Actinomycetota bacterium]
MSIDGSQVGAGRADRAARLGACVERARHGERGALDEVVRELNPLLWHVARAQGLGAEEAADVVQTTWLELLRRLHEIRSPQALTGWLVTTTRRGAWHVRERSRRQESDTRTPPELAPDPGAEPHERLLSDERDQALWRHFRRLSERCRALLRIVAEVDRPDYSVVAEALDMPRGSIGPTRGRCLAKLREMLLADPAWSAA